MAFKVTKSITSKEVLERLQKKEDLFMIDVREPGEWAMGHVAGAVHFPLSQLAELQKKLDRRRETIVMCQSGARSALACEMLTERGFDVVNMTGGLNAWRGPLVRG